jgi:hypothetical protein
MDLLINNWFLMALIVAIAFINIYLPFKPIGPKAVGITKKQLKEELNNALCFYEHCERAYELCDAHARWMLEAQLKGARSRLHDSLKAYAAVNGYNRTAHEFQRVEAVIRK